MRKLHFTLLLFLPFEYFSGIFIWHIKYLTETQVIKARVSIELYRNLHVFEVQSKTLKTIRFVFLVFPQNTSHRASQYKPCNFHQQRRYKKVSLRKQIFDGSFISINKQNKRQYRGLSRIGSCASTACTTLKKISTSIEPHLC